MAACYIEAVSRGRRCATGTAFRAVRTIPRTPHRCQPDGMSPHSSSTDSPDHRATSPERSPAPQDPSPPEDRRGSPSDSREDTQDGRSEEHTSELQSRGHLVCRLLLEKKKNMRTKTQHQNQLRYERE